MRRIVLLTCALAGAVACERVDVDFNTDGEEDSASIDAVAVEYPKGYDWRKDSLGAESQVCLVLYRDWERVLSVDVGSDAAYSDMHRILDGHLYTDYSTSDETVIVCDAVELFRYQGRESIKDIFVRDTSVFTLGVSRNGEGFSFRRNGRIVISQENGQLLSGLDMDEGQLCFAYKVPLVEGSGVYRYYISRNGVLEQIVIPADMTEVSSMRLWKGELNYLGYSSAVGGILRQTGYKTSILSMGAKNIVFSGSFMEIGGELYAHAYFLSSVLSVGSSLWKGDTLAYRSENNGMIYASCKGSKCFAITPGGRSWPVYVVQGDRLDTIPPNLAMISPEALCCKGKDYYLGLNDREKDYAPVVLHGKDTVRFGFNGYFSCFSSR